MTTPAQVTLELTPSARFDVIDVSRLFDRDFGRFLDGCRRVLYCSHHTTAGYPDQQLAERLGHSRDRLSGFLEPFRSLFPQGAPYRHDEMELRDELTAEQKRVEPRNADSHLTFMSAGLHNCVTYDHRPSEPVWFVDLDGVHEHGVRTRRTTVLGFQRDDVVGVRILEIPVSAHPIDSVNLCAPELGLVDGLQEQIREHGVANGRLDLELLDEESHAGLTVNEYETLLMRHDLREVLRDPLRYMAERGRNLLRDPRSAATKTLNYAQYDLVQIYNELMSKVGHGAAYVEELVARFIAMPTIRFFGLKRSASFLVHDGDGRGWGSIVQGTYQSPILVQWSRCERGARRVRATLSRFE
jgi:thiamine phosphate synthase YjbQ (UPF0047 family)